MGYVIGRESRAKLQGVHPELVKLAERAIQITPIDFAVHDGVRTIEQQKKNLASGASHTLDSRHLYGLAVDLVPIKAGKLSWDWEDYWPMVSAVMKAAKELGMDYIEWGGVFDKEISQYTDPKAECAAYVEREKARGKKKVFIDGPHFQLPKRLYPNPK